MLQLRFPPLGEPSYSSLRRTPGEGRPQPRSANAPHQAGPRQYEPSGKRYTIDRNAISYMGWTFQVCNFCAPAICKRLLLISKAPFPPLRPRLQSGH